MELLQKAFFFSITSVKRDVNVIGRLQRRKDD